MDLLDPFNSNDKGNKLAKLIQVGTEESQEEVLLNLIEAYKDFPSMNFVVLSLDMDYMDAGSAIVNYPTQLLELRRIKGRYGDRVNPFVCVDPRRYQGKELVDFVDEHINEYGFSGIKMYPALGFYPFDPALYELYEYAEKFQIPIMTHCDRGGVNYQGKITEEHINPLYFSRMPGKNTMHVNRQVLLDEERNKLRKESNDVFCDRFTDPSNYYKVLDAFPNLKICFAHLGGVDEILKKPKTNQGSWYDTIRSFISDIKYKNVYTDVSYTLENKKAMDVLLDDLNSDLNFQSKVLFGTDFFVVNKNKTEEELVSDFRKIVDVQLFDVLASDNNTEYLKIDTKVYQKKVQGVTKPEEEETEGTYKLEGKVKLKKSK